MIADTKYLLQAKGYPDLFSRAFLRLASTPSSRNGFRAPPVYALVDYDPHGLDILSTYKNGSLSLAHENENLKVQSLQLLGLRSLDIVPTDASDDLQMDQIMPLGAFDRAKALQMLPKQIELSGYESPLVRELQRMLMLNVKAEMQFLEASPAGISGWLSQQLSFRK